MSNKLDVTPEELDWLEYRLETVTQDTYTDVEKLKRDMTELVTLLLNIIKKNI